MLKHCFPVLALLALVTAACRNENARQPAGPAEAQLPEGFSEFYQRFMTDSLYQIEHIVFPLEGVPDNADGLHLRDGNFRWQAGEWIMHRPIDPIKTGFDIEMASFGEDIVTETIVHRSGDFGMLRRYARMGEDWYLIYYAGLNPLTERTR